MTAPVAGVEVGEGTVWYDEPGQARLLEVPVYTRYPDRSVRALPSVLVVGAFQARFKIPACAAGTKSRRSSAPRATSEPSSHHRERVRRTAEQILRDT
jgi:tRNA G37 N-methylase TrmD